jgi:nuclear GTP-binding protein
MRLQRSHIVETEPFGETFGPKSQRKRPRIDAGSFEELGKLGAAAMPDISSLSVDPEASTSGIIYHPTFIRIHLTQLLDLPSVIEETTHADFHEPIYAKGTSRRIYGELYKVIDSSDVILHILDARDPLGTMCESVLEYIKKEKAHKQVVLVINKCDLVPNWVTVSYIILQLERHSFKLYLPGSLHQTSHPSLPYHRLPCVRQPFIRKGLPYSTVAAVPAAPQR